MPAELDASLRWMQCCTCILLLKERLQGLIIPPDIFITLFLLPFTKISSWLIFIILSGDWQLTLQLCSPLLTFLFFFFSLKLVLKEQFIRQFAAFIEQLILVCAG